MVYFGNVWLWNQSDFQCNKHIVFCLDFESLCCRFQVKYLGEEGENTPLAGAASICSPWDLVVSLLKFSCIKFTYLISFSHALSSMYYILCFELVYCNIMLENFSFSCLVLALWIFTFLSLPWIGFSVQVLKVGDLTDVLCFKLTFVDITFP